MNALSAIAANTFREAVRQKLILLVSLTALALVASSDYLTSLDLGNERMSFIFDFGSGAIGFFGSIIAIVATCQLFHSEIENKTVITLLSKPVGFADFAFGKIAGSAAALGLFCAVMAAATAVMLAYAGGANSAASDNLPTIASPNYAGIAAFAFVQWLKLCCVAALSALVCSMSRSLLFSVVIAFMCLAISAIGSATVGLGGADSQIVKFAANIFPDFQTFSAAESFAFAPINWKSFLGASAYGIIYAFVCAALSAWNFSRREF